MCTSIFMGGENSFFGRNMDLYFKVGGNVVITPRNYPFRFRAAGEMKEHFAIIGMSMIKDGYPLYFEAVNERGVCIAGLDFPRNAYYSGEFSTSKNNISPFEFIPWVLGQCATLDEARNLINHTHITAIPFSQELPLSPLHWHIADKNSSIVFEVTKKGANVFDNPTGIMTNNPTFDFHMQNLSHYLNLFPENSKNCFSRAGIEPFSFGMGATGLPGDFSSTSRFVKASYLLKNSSRGDITHNSVSQFFHILSSVAMVRGSVVTENGAFDTTAYSCCIDMNRVIYYYTTYENNRITAVSLLGADVDGSALIEFKTRDGQDILYEN